MLAIGLMSGTSLDGVDAALIETDGECYFKPLSTFHLPYSSEFQAKLRNLLDNTENWLFIEKELTLLHYDCVKGLLKTSNIHVSIDVIGFHGQTIYHNPSEGITWQIGNANLLAQLTGIDVVSDFRRLDVAYGGQGAPLVPIFHKCLVSNVKKPLAILNIGGVANFTYIDDDDDDDDEIIAFDTGPGNALINDATLKHFNSTYDDNGKIASEGIINQKQIDEILEDKYFQKKPRNDFMRNIQLFKDLKPNDLISTLTKLTVDSILQGMTHFPKSVERVYVCGGGCHNHTIMKWLNKYAKNVEFISIKELNYDPDNIEAQAFAYLAVRCLKNLPSTFPSTTGVSKKTVCGVVFKA